MHATLAITVVISLIAAASPRIIIISNDSSRPRASSEKWASLSELLHDADPMENDVFVELFEPLGSPSKKEDDMDVSEVKGQEQPLHSQLSGLPPTLSANRLLTLLLASERTDSPSNYEHEEIVSPFGDYDQVDYNLQPAYQEQISNVAIKSTLPLVSTSTKTLSNISANDEKKSSNDHSDIFESRTSDNSDATKESSIKDLPPVETETTESKSPRSDNPLSNADKSFASRIGQSENTNRSPVGHVLDGFFSKFGLFGDAKAERYISSFRPDGFK